LDGLDRDEHERRRKKEKLDNLIKARGGASNNGRTQARRTPEARLC